MGVRRGNPKKPDHRSERVNMKIIALALSLASLVQGESLFLPTAVDGVEIKLRGRDRGPDITQVELHIRPKEVALSGTVPSLEYKEEDGCWKPAPKNQVPQTEVRGRGGGWTCQRLARSTSSASHCNLTPASNTWRTSQGSSQVRLRTCRWVATTLSSGTQCLARPT